MDMQQVQGFALILMAAAGTIGVVGFFSAVWWVISHIIGESDNRD